MMQKKSHEENDLEGIPPMTTMQKVIIGLAVAAVVAFAVYMAMH